MATLQVVLPEIREGIEGGEVVQVLVAVGEHIDAEQIVLELETDKAVMSIPAPASGTVLTLHVQAHEKISVGQLLLTLDTAAPAASAPLPSSTPVPVPAVTPQPPMAAPAPTPVAAPVVPVEPPRAATAATPQLAAPAAPSVRLLAREIGVDINQVPGTGPGGRIALEDVKRYARDLLTRPASRPGVTGMPAQALPDFTRWGTVQRQAMSNVRRATAERMAYAWGTIPHVTQFDTADITDLEALRRRYDQERVQPAGGRLTVTAIVLKVLAAALKRFPQFNASLDVASQEIVFKQYYHLGVAVDTDRGLLVPVIRDVDQKNMLALAVELSEIGVRARERKLSLDDMQGGTFTVTNLGGLGGTYFTPIINAPEVAILGLSRSRMAPVYDPASGQFTPRLQLPLALSYDHRLIDGADGVRFLRWVVEALEQPFLLALEG